MNNDRNYPEILNRGLQLGPYPMEKLKKVDKPTTFVSHNIPRFDERQTGFARAFRGELGNINRKSTQNSASALSASVMSALNFIGSPDGTASSPSESTSQDFPLPDLPNNPAILSNHIKSMAYFVGADVVGICELPQWAVYSHDARGNPVELYHKYAICIAVDQGLKTMEAARGNDWISGSQSGRGYAMCGFIGNIVADYIRRLGYPARLHYIKDYKVVVPPLLLLSGIGEMSRAGVVLNPFLGMRFKASVVTTDLPLETDKPIDFGLQDFCNKCLKCAVESPSRSISKGDKKVENGYEHWEFNAETCTRYRLGNPDGLMCGRCIIVCPWNKPQGWTHDLVRWMVKHTPAFNGLLVKLDDLFGYGQPNAIRQWWFNP